MHIRNRQQLPPKDQDVGVVGFIVIILVALIAMGYGALIFVSMMASLHYNRPLGEVIRVMFENIF